MFTNVDFKKDVHISDCTIGEVKEINFSGINFSGNCYFSGTMFKDFSKFEKATFHNNVDFQKAKFEKGLDISKTTIKKGMNFAGCDGLHTEESIKNTPTETYRIIKNHFLKLQNKIEANKFYSLELEKHGSELETLSDKITYLAHRISSNYGRSWPLALFGIIIIGFFTFLYIDFEAITHASGCIREIVSYGFFESVKYSYILNRSKDFFENHPFVFFLNKVFLGYWYYQFIMATRKDTKK